MVSLGAVFSIGMVLLAGTAPVERASDLAYLSDGETKHQLDVYLPVRRDGATLVVFVHGGAFMSGDRRDYAAVGRALAERGYAVAIPSYRLYPHADAQDAVRDVAAAIAWLARHSERFGYDAKRVVLAGHSAGGQIVAMLATHKRYLQRAGAPAGIVRGAFALAGAYDVRDLTDEPAAWQRIDDRIFGATEAARGRISPAIDVDRDAPPIVAVCGTHDDPGACARARHFARVLKARGLDGSALEIDTDHGGLLRRFIQPGDALAEAFRAFIERTR